MADPQDVTPEADPSPASPTEPLAQASDAGSEPDSSARVDRPVENAVAEFNRKFTRIERQMEALIQAQTQPRATPAAETHTGSDPTDEQLWTAAQQGSRPAFDLYMQRVAARTAQTQMGQERYSRLIDSQLAVLGQKYPVLQDQSHPLAQTAGQAYALLVNQGYPQTKATWLEAVKTAIADRPDLIAEMHGAAVTRGDAGRLSAARVAQAGQTPAAGRATPPPTRTTVRPVSKEEAALAARMGIKDPAKARENFRKRREAGTSNIGAVGSQLNEEDL